jgi:hypothetical protein
MTREEEEGRTRCKINFSSNRFHFSFWPFGSWRKINKLSALYDRYKAASFKFDTSQKTNEKINKQVRNGGGKQKECARSGRK